MFTELDDRVLWYDGSISLDGTASNLDQLLMKYPTARLFVTEISDEVKRFNRMASQEERLSVKQANDEIECRWKIPDQYKNLDVMSTAKDKLIELCKDKSDEYKSTAAHRLIFEFNKFTELGFLDLIRTVVFIVNMLDSRNIPRGLGRGSSTSSYLLFLLGVHDVDCVEFDVAFSDFIQ